MSAFPNYDFAQAQAGAEGAGTGNPAQVPAQPQTPAMAPTADNAPAAYPGGAQDPVTPGTAQAGGDSKTTLWSVIAPLFPPPGG